MGNSCKEIAMRWLRDYTLCSLQYLYLYSWISLQPDSQKALPCPWMRAALCTAYIKGHQI